MKKLSRSNYEWLYLPVYLLIFGTSLLLYSNILTAEFVYDDVVFRDNPKVHVTRLGQIFDIIIEPESWRRVGLATFALNFYLGGLDPFGYHLVNVFIHSLNGFLLFLVTLKTLTLPSLQRKWEDRAFATALLGTMVWLVHPVQIMAVTYTVQRFASLSALFSLLSLFFYILGRQRSGWSRAWPLGLCASGAVMAFGSKENSAVFPFVILLYEFLFFTDKSHKGNRKRLLWWAAAIVGLLILLAFVYMGPEMATKIMEDSRNRGWHPYERCITQFRVIVLYITLLIWPNPVRLNVDYDFPLSTGLFSPPSTFISLILLAVLVAFAVARARRNPLLSFAILWFFLNLAIESSFLPLDLVYEHRLYLPSMGPVMLFAGWILSIKHQRLKRAAMAATAVFMVVLAYWTHERNVVWKNPVSLWEDNAAKSPNRARVHGNLGKAYLDKREYEKARIEFEKTIALDPTFLGAYDNLAVIYIDNLREYEKARKYLIEAIERNPDYPSPYLNLGVIHLHMRELPQAVQAFEKVLKLDPESRLGHFNLAAAHFNLKDYDKAVAILNSGISIWPQSANLYALLGATHFHKGDSQKAKVALTQALGLDPSNGMARHYIRKL